MPANRKATANWWLSVAEIIIQWTTPNLKELVLISFSQATVLTFCVFAGFASAAFKRDSLQVLSSGDAVVVAEVRNERYCDRDGVCALRFKVGGKPGAVIYAHGDVERVKPCGRDLFTSAWSIQDGTWIQARGQYRVNGAAHDIDICASPEAFLRRLP